MAGRSGGGLRGLERLSRRLPHGVELYRLRAEGGVLLGDRSGARELGPADEFLRFIDDGQFARYFIGDAATSPERPSNATFKLGVVGPRSAFTPHAHAGEHVVLSLGYAACGLYDSSRGKVVNVPLTPGTMVRIPEMMPHSFANRGPRPLNILAANTGYGIDHEDYAITAGEAERRAADGRRAGGGTVPAGTAEEGPVPVDTLARVTVDHGVLAAALRGLERAQRVGSTTVRERAAARLRRLASTLEESR